MTDPNGRPPGAADGDPFYVEPWQQGWYAPAQPHPQPQQPPAPPPPPARNRRIHPAVLVVVGICVAAAVVGLLAATLRSSDTVDAPGTDGRRLVVPASISGFRVLSDVRVDDLKANLGEELAGDDEDPQDVVRHAAVGAWQHLATNRRVVFLGLALRDLKSFRGQVETDGVRASLAFFMAGVSGDLTDPAKSTVFPPGPRGGFMRCAAVDQSGQPATVCGWGDESAFGLTLVAGRIELPATATIARTLREAIESE